MHQSSFSDTSVTSMPCLCDIQRYSYPNNCSKCDLHQYEIASDNCPGQIYDNDAPETLKCMHQRTSQFSAESHPVGLWEATALGQAQERAAAVAEEQAALTAQAWAGTKAASSRVPDLLTVATYGNFLGVQTYRPSCRTLMPL